MKITAILILKLSVFFIFLSNSTFAQYVFPLKVSSNKRFLTDNNGTPFLYHADTKWVVFQCDLLAQAETYFETRKQQGFTTIMLHILPFAPQFKGNVNAYGDEPFLNGGFDITKPNEAYFKVCDQIIDLATQKGLFLTIFPIWQSDWQQHMNVNNSTTYATFLGNRYKSYKNIMWVMGGDANYSDKANEYNAIATKLKSIAPQQLITIHGAYDPSAQLSNASWLDVNMAYSYNPVNAQISNEYANRNPIRPIVLGESDYEFDWRNRGSDQMRVQAYHAMLSGACGHAFGNNPIWNASAGWQNAYYSEGAVGMTHLAALYNSIPWYNLVPDLSNEFLTNSNLGADYEYSVASITSDGSLGLIYIPTSRTVTINMAKMSAANNAQWYNCKTGTYTAAGSALSNSGTRNFSTPNGGVDFVLILTAVNIPPVSVTSISISPTSTSIAKGANLNLIPTILPNNASNKNVTWSSSNTAVATVNSSGIVTGVSVGNVIITVKTSDGNKTATASVSVSSSDIYEAENGTVGGSAVFQVEPNASNGKVVAYMDAIGAYSQIGTVAGGTGGSATLSIRYANGYTVNSTVSLYVNNVKTGQLTFTPTGDWAVFAEITTNITLNAGAINTIKLQKDANDVSVSDIDKYTIVPTVITGASEQKIVFNTEELSIYPNPSRSQFTVSLPNQTFELQIFNADGTEVLKQTVRGSFTNESTFAAGVYVVKTTTTNGNTHVRKLVIQ